MDYTMLMLRFIYGILWRKLTNIVVYTTNRCNSRCKTCFIWKKQPKIDISTTFINRMLKDEMAKGATLKITGGEFLLHPQHEEILTLINESGLKYQLFSNGILAGRLIQIVREFQVKEVALSCDGLSERYRKIRGVDGFDKIIRIIDELRGETNITLNYTVSPLNSKSDLIQVADFAVANKVKLVIGVFNNPEYFGVTTARRKVYTLDGVTGRCLQMPRRFVNKYIELYNLWVEGKYKIPCLNIRSQVVAYPNGEVYLCEGKQVSLGSLRKESLKDIWNSGKTISLQEQNKRCNACFLTCQRPSDIIIHSTPLRLFVK